MSCATPTTSPGAPRGRLAWRHPNACAGGRARFQPMLELADGTLLELNYGLSHAPNVNPGSNVTIKGSRKGNTVLVAAGGAGPAPAGRRREDETRRGRPFHLLERYGPALYDRDRQRRRVHELQLRRRVLPRELLERRHAHRGRLRLG